MTTKSSPIQVLKAQADKIAKAIKESGRDECKAGVVMDDKILIVTCQDVKGTPERELAKFILNQMQENK